MEPEVGGGAGALEGGPLEGGGLVDPAAGEHQRDRADRGGDEEPDGDEHRRTDRAGHRHGETEAGAGDAGHPHVLGGLLGGLVVAVGDLHVLDHDRTGAALVAAEAAERHLDAVDLLAGGEQAIGRPPQRGLVEEPELADDQVGGGRQLGDRQHLETAVEGIPERLGVGDGVDQGVQAGRDLVAQRRRGGQLVGVEALGATEAGHGCGEVIGRLRPLGGERLDGVGVGQEVAVGVDARGARLERGGL